jgi:hypothetical protein
MAALLSLLTSLSWPWRIALIAVLLLLCVGLYEAGHWIGHSRGYAEAEAKGEAALEKEHRERAEEYRAAAEAQAAAEREARQRLEASQAKNDELTGRLLAVQMDAVTERAAFNRRIDDVSLAASRTCAGLPASWVRQYNAALGLDSGETPLPTADSPGGSADGVHRDSPALSGLPPATPVTGSLVSPADVLAHIRDLGAVLRDQRVRLAAWRDWYAFTRQQYAAGTVQ